MKKVATSVICGLAGLYGFSVSAESRPKLVVGIVVDQLRTDYVEYLQDLFSEGGFKRFIKDGAFIRDIDFKVPNPDAASATAIIQTGTYPRHNGVPAAEIYNITEKTVSPVFLDNSYIGNFTTETYSPGAIRVNTIADEIAAEGENNSRIHTLAPDAERAIILSGHAGNSAFWINDNTGKWSTSTYYTSPPASIQNSNYNTPLVNRLDTIRWQPLLQADYPGISSKTEKEGFRYNFSRSDRDVYKLFKSSPFVNREITDLAVNYLTELQLGKSGESTDMLGLAYTLAPYPASLSSDPEFELEDAYLRLDRDLQRLLSAIDSSIGLENALVYLTSTGYYTETHRPDVALRLPTGNFSVKRALSLLNSYLSAKYGNDPYVSHYYSGNIFLNRNLIEEKGLDLNRISEDSRDFLVKMSGVSDAYTITDLMSPSVPQLEGHRLASDPKTGGDIIIEFNPGWTVTDDTKYPSEIQPQKYTVFESPAFFLGAGIKPQIITTPVDAAAVAPTVARVLRIRSPNGAVAKPLNLK